MANIPRYRLVKADAGRGLPLADESISACVTSPPYYQLRRYEGVEPTDWPQMAYVPMTGLQPIEIPAMRCCLGIEDTIEAYVGHLVLIGREIRRVLHDTGTFWLNISDSYSTSPRGNKPGDFSKSSLTNPWRQDEVNREKFDKTKCGIPALNLLGVPWRVAFALQADGFFLRSAPPWIKPGNAMPESVTSRPTTAHESLFLLAKTSDYYFDMDNIRRGLVSADRIGEDGFFRGNRRSRNDVDDVRINGHRDDRESMNRANPAGRNLRTSDFFLDSLDDAIAHHEARAAELRRARDSGGMVAGDDGDSAAVLINPESYRGSHYAVMPSRLASILVKCSTSEAGCCSKCGGPFVRVVEQGELKPLPTSGFYTTRTDSYAKGPMDRGGKHQRLAGSQMCYRERHHLGWRPSCTCPDPTTRRPVVLDPFAGSGTTAVVSLALGRDCVCLDASAEYLAMARHRLERPHAKPPAPVRPDEALPLFANLEE
jgi:hypothetical protein